MDGLKAMEQRQDSQRKASQRKRTDLDRRYLKIGISAVAAAVRHQSEQHNATESRAIPYDRD